MKILNKNQPNNPSNIQICFARSLVGIVPKPSVTNAFTLNIKALNILNLVNWAMGDRHRRIDMTIGVAYGSHLNPIKEGLERILKGHPASHAIGLPAPVQ
jgi:hypothetical protein